MVCFRRAGAGLCPAGDFDRPCGRCLLRVQVLGGPSEALATDVFDARSLPAHLCASRRLGMFFLRFTKFALQAVSRLLDRSTR